MDLKPIKENALKGLSVAAGVALAVVLVRQFGDKAPAWAKSFLAIVPGGILAISAYKNPYALLGGLGMIGAGSLVGLKQLTDGKTGFLATINQNLPGLAGPNDVQYYDPQQDNALLSGINGLGQLNYDNMLLS